MAVQEKTSDPFPPQLIGGLGRWVKDQRDRKKIRKSISKAEEDRVRSIDQSLSL